LKRAKEKMLSRERLYQGWRVIKHGRLHFPKARNLLVDPDNTKLEWRKFNEGKPLTSPDGEVLLKDIVRITKGKQSTILSNISGVDERNCVTIHINKKSATLDLELRSEEERDMLHAALQQLIPSSKS